MFQIFIVRYGSIVTESIPSRCDLRPAVFTDAKLSRLEQLLSDASMTTLIARQPLQTLSMSSSQRGPRRLSARLQEKEDAQPRTNGYHLASTNQLPGSAKDGAPTRRAQDKPPATKKRKIGEATRSLAGSPNWMGRKLMESSTDYDEEDDGFMFTRAKARKSRPSASKSTSNSGQATVEKENSIPSVVENVVHAKGEPESEESLKKRRNRMSFSTTNVIAEKPVRRSKRLSDEAERRDGSAQSKARKEDEARVNNSKRPPEPRRPPQQQNTPLPPQSEDGEDHSETKIALPFADTPVIRKNKAMRERKSGKGERRSSLGLRGRRASSLIDSGSSNGEHINGRGLEVRHVLTEFLALPHSEVDVVDFFKHIESEGLSEPRRMRQLLTWCATRAMGEPSTGSPHPHPVYEDQSARLAGEHSSYPECSILTVETARVIQKELLKDFANRSEMSDWFGREDVQKVEKPLPMKPNPKNIRNAAKIEELETQIKRYPFSLTPVRVKLQLMNFSGCDSSDNLSKHYCDLLLFRTYFQIKCNRRRMLIHPRSTPRFSQTPTPQSSKL